MTSKVSLIELGKQTVAVLADNIDARNDDLVLAKEVFRRTLSDKEKYRADLYNRVALRHNGSFAIIQALRIRLQMLHKMYLPTRPAVRKQRGISDDDFNAWQTGTAALPGFA